MGSISIQVTERNGQAVGALMVESGDEAMLITNGGTLVRTRIDEVSVIGRNTQGVRLINVSGDERLISVEKVVESDDDDLEVGQEAEVAVESATEQTTEEE